MKSYDELKAEMETIQQQMAEAKKNERTNVRTHSKKWSGYAKSLALLVECLRVRWLKAENQNKSKVYLPT